MCVTKILDDCFLCLSHIFLGIFACFSCRFCSRVFLVLLLCCLRRPCACIICCFVVLVCFAVGVRYDGDFVVCFVCACAYLVSLYLCVSHTYLLGFGFVAAGVWLLRVCAYALTSTMHVREYFLFTHAIACYLWFCHLFNQFNFLYTQPEPLKMAKLDRYV